MEAAQIPWRPIGELFVEKGLISQDQLEEALAEQAATERRLGEILVKRNLISSPELTQALMEQLGREVAKEEGFGTGLWSEIRRRNTAPGSIVEPVPPDADRSPFGGGLTLKLGAGLDDAFDLPAPDGPAVAFGHLHAVVAPVDDGMDDTEADVLRLSLAEAHAEIETLRQELAERAAPGSERVDALERELAAAEGELRTRGARVEELDATLLARDEHIAALQKSLEELGSLQAGSGDEAKLESALAAEQDAHGETRQRLDDATRAEQDAKQALLEAERVLASAQAEQARLEEQLQAAEARTAEQGDEISGLTEQLDAFRLERDELAEQAHGLREELTSGQAEAAAELRAAEERITDLAAIVDRLDDEKSELAQALAELAARETVPVHGNGTAPSPEEYLCFAPTSDGYRLVAREGILPAAGDGCDVDGVAHVIVRVSRSPLPFDARSCVYLMAAS